MKMKTLAAMALAGSMTPGTAMADLVIPDLSYRTGPFAAGGMPFSDGYQDYFALLNARDGGIGGGSAEAQLGTDPVGFVVHHPHPQCRPPNERAGTADAEDRTGRGWDNAGGDGAEPVRRWSGRAPGYQ